MSDMLSEFKFAINPWAGDTKPIKSEGRSKATSQMLLSKSTAEYLLKYGVIGDDNISKRDSTYAEFNDHY